MWCIIQTNQKLDSIANRTELYSFTFAGSSEEYSFFFVDGTQAVNQALEELKQVFPYLIITVLLISVSAAFVCSKYITLPVRRISRASQKMIALNFSVQEKSRRTDEQRTEFFSAVSHELKTPSP